MNDEEKKKVLYLRSRGMSYATIAREMGKTRRAIRLICDPAAREKNRIHNREYYVAHQEQILVAQRKYHAENRKEILIRKRKSYAEHPEKSAAYHREYYINHREELIAYGHEYRIQYPEETAACNRKYRNEHREELAAKQRKHSQTAQGRLNNRNAAHRRRELEQHGEGFTVDDYEYLWEKQQGRCAYCDRRMIRFEDVKGTLFEKTVPFSDDRYCNTEHRFPMSKGGPNGLSNIVLACAECNGEKGTAIWELHCKVKTNHKKELK